MDIPKNLQAHPAVQGLQTRLNAAIGRSRALRGVVGDAASVRALATTAIGGGGIAYVAERLSGGAVLFGGVPASGVAGALVGALGVWQESPTLVAAGGGAGAVAVRDFLRSKMG